MEDKNIPETPMGVETPVGVDDVSEFGYKQELNRALGLKDLIIAGLVYVIPIAPIAIFGYVYTASNGMVPTTYFIGLVAIFFTALAYAAFSRKFPIAGSAYSYIQRAVNPHVGFIFGWLILLDYVFMPGFCFYLGGAFLQEVFPGAPIPLVVVICAVIVCFFIIRGVSVTAKLNMILCVLQCIIGAIIVVMCIMFLAKGGGSGFTFKPFYNPEFFDFKFVTSAVTIAAMSFLGFDGISALSEEVKDPHKTMPRGLIWTVIILGIIFIIITYFGAAVIPEGTTGLDTTGFTMVTDLIDPSGTMTTVISITMFVAVGIAATLMNATAASRILYGMGRDGMMPRVFAKVHPKYQSPYIAAICLTIITVAVCLIIDNDTLGTIINFGALTTFAMLNLCVIIYFYGKQHERGVYGFFRYVIVPVIGFAVIAMCWIGFSKLAFIVGFTWMGIGIIIGAVLSKGYKIVPEAFRNMEDL